MFVSFEFWRNILLSSCPRWIQRCLRFLLKAVYNYSAKNNNYPLFRAWFLSTWRCTSIQTDYKKRIEWLNFILNNIEKLNLVENCWWHLSPRHFKCWIFQAKVIKDIFRALHSNLSGDQIHLKNWSISF